MRPRYLTKSRFKIAAECPAKLFCSNKKEEYQNINDGDQFLLALAEGGFQVGELAKLYFPGGVEVETLNYDDALAQTNRLLEQENVIIYEAAVKFNNLFIRIDILIKNGNHLDLIEVKAKSIPNCDSDIFLTKKNHNISSKWKPYLMDVAFQKYVTEKAFPEMSVSSYLMLSNKQSKTSVSGLNQKFLLQKDETGRKKIKVLGNKDLDALGTKILCQMKVDDILVKIYKKNYIIAGKTFS
ncbi:MAG: hypothetical protein L3J56_13720, partial [Bacteroidales bacterium]|nr:hypothetical protein [Bacteroidales bacterium]